MIEYTRTLGIIFDTTTVDRVAALVHRMCRHTEGPVGLFVNRYRFAQAAICGTSDHKRRSERETESFVGDYWPTFCEGSKTKRQRAEFEKRIADDIWCHLEQMAGRESEEGQRVRAAKMQTEIMEAA